MVNPRTISEYRCGKCNLSHNTLIAAEKCCEVKVADWENVMVFDLREEHLKLLSEANIVWDDCEFGAPGMDPKRPYGNSDVTGDIAEIIKLPKTKNNYDEDEECWKENAEDKLSDLHRQVMIAMKIVLRCRSFKLGKYQRTDKYKDDWKYMGE